MNKLKLMMALPVAAMAVAVVPTAASAQGTPAITVTPSTNLTNGQTVNVEGTGYPAGASVVVLQCNSTTPSREKCDTANIKFATASATGTISTTFPVKTGTIGDGTCAAGSSTCVISGATPDGAAAANKSISFAAAPAAAATPAATTAPAATKAPTAAKPAAAAPTRVNAGSGGQADPNLLPLAALALAGAGAATAGAVSLRRR